jgi:hypothetical protein
MNVGGLHGELSSPAMKRASVGGAIVLGAWESHVQGTMATLGTAFPSVPKESEPPSSYLEKLCKNRAKINVHEVITIDK